MHLSLFGLSILFKNLRLWVWSQIMSMIDSGCYYEFKYAYLNTKSKADTLMFKLLWATMLSTWLKKIEDNYSC